MGRLRLTGALLAALGCLSVPVALAMPKYRNAAVVQLHYDVGNPLWQLDRRVMACTFCHVSEAGGAPWNVFGEALKAGFRADAASGKHSAFGAILYSVLKTNGDADGDGYPDAVEIYAHTLPGDPASTPKPPLPELEAAFGRAGGVAQYAPGFKPAPVQPASAQPAPVQPGPPRP
jgi:hypothetical protein